VVLGGEKKTQYLECRFFSPPLRSAFLIYRSNPPIPSGGWGEVNFGRREMGLFAFVVIKCLYCQPNLSYHRLNIRYYRAIPEAENCISMGAKKFRTGRVIFLLG
jgi:hypothetical protein